MCPHLLVGIPISLLRLIISENRETTPIYLSGYLSFIAKFSFLFRLTTFIDYIREYCQSTHSLVKNAAKSPRGSGQGCKRKEQALSRCGRWEGVRKENTSSSSSSSVILRFVTVLQNFKLLVFLDHLKYGHLPNRGYFKSSVHTGRSKEEAVFSKL